MYNEAIKGNIFNIKRFAVHDGPGIRATVFLRGCPLKCKWCHNPESRGNCHIGPAEDFKTVSEVVELVEKDTLFFDESGGGVTISGGEPLEQWEFLLPLLSEFRKRDIHSALDTTGYADEEVFKKITALTDMCLYDLKHMDDNSHIRYTGVSNRTILENFETLSATGKRVWVRYPMIPGMNDGEENVRKMGDFLKGRENVERVSVLPYHPLGSHKYEKLGAEWEMGDIKTPGEEMVEKVCAILGEYGLTVFKGG